MSLSYLLLKMGLEKIDQIFDKDHDFKKDLRKFTIDTINQFDKLLINKVNILPEDNLEINLHQFLEKYKFLDKGTFYLLIGINLYPGLINVNDITREKIKLEFENIKKKPIDYIDSSLLTEIKILDSITILYRNILKYFDYFSNNLAIKDNFDANYKKNKFPNEQIKIKTDQLALSILTNIHGKNRKVSLTDYYKKYLILYVTTFVQNAYKLFVMEFSINEAMIPLKKTSFHLLALTNYDYLEKNLINYIQLPIHQNEVNKITQLFELFKNKCENLKTEKDLREVIEIHYHLESLKLGDKTFDECKEISHKLLKKFDNYCDSWEIIVFDIILFWNSSQMSQDLFLERLNYSYSFHMNIDFKSGI